MGRQAYDYGTQRGLPQTIELRSIWIMRRQKGAAPYDRAQIHMDWGPRHTIELRSIWIMGRQKWAAPDDRVHGSWDAKMVAPLYDRARIYIMDLWDATKGLRQALELDPCGL